MDSASKILTLKQGLRIKFSADPAGLRKLWEEVWKGASRFVEITGNSYEGGSASGTVILERLEYLAAVQDILAELDPAGTPMAPPRGALADFRWGTLQT